MPTFKPEKLLRASTVTEVLDVFKKYGDKARIVGGNTFLNELSKRGLLPEVKVLVDISGLDLGYVKYENGTLLLGSSVTIQQLANEIRVKSDNSLKALSLAANAVHPVQVRNTATLGGCVSTGLPFLDLPCALLALESTITLCSIDSNGAEVRMDLGDYLSQIFKLADQSFIKDIQVQSAKAGIRSASSFQKFGLTGFDYGVVSAAVKLSKDAKDVCTRASIALCGKGLDLERMSVAERKLVGNKLTQEILEQAAESASSEFKNMTDDIPIRGSVSFKRHIAKVMVARALRDAAHDLEIDYGR